MSSVPEQAEIQICKGQTALNWGTGFFAADGASSSNRAKTLVPPWQDQVANRVKHGIGIPF